MNVTISWNTRQSKATICSATNQLILNLKKSPERQGRPDYRRLKTAEWRRLKGNGAFADLNFQIDEAKLTLRGFKFGIPSIRSAK